MSVHTHTHTPYANNGKCVHVCEIQYGQWIKQYKEPYNSEKCLIFAVIAECKFVHYIISNILWFVSIITHSHTHALNYLIDKTHCLSIRVWCVGSRFLHFSCSIALRTNVDHHVLYFHHIFPHNSTYSLSLSLAHSFARSVTYFCITSVDHQGISNC